MRSKTCRSTINKGQTAEAVGRRSGQGKIPRRAVYSAAVEPSREVNLDGKHHGLIRVALHQARNENMQMILSDPFASLIPQDAAVGIKWPNRSITMQLKGRADQNASRCYDSSWNYRSSFSAFPHGFQRGQRQRCDRTRLWALNP